MHPALEFVHLLLLEREREIRELVRLRGFSGNRRRSHGSLRAAADATVVGIKRVISHLGHLSHRPAR